MTRPLLEVSGLAKHFPVHRGLLRRKVGELKAVDELSFEVYRGETLSLVGESGCGKTTAARTLLRLYEPTAGRALYRSTEDAEPVDLFTLGREELRRVRRELSIVFQDPYESLNPRMSVAEIIAEPLRVHRDRGSVPLDTRVRQLLDLVGLRGSDGARFPHEFSGGQRQRIGIARAIALEPKFIVCDEAVSALDVSIQAQILNLLQDLQEELGLSYLFIAHDLSVVRHISDRVAVMYLGRIVEVGTREDVFERPQHPYTRLLLEAVPSLLTRVHGPTSENEVSAPGDPHGRGQKNAPAREAGDVPSPLDPPSGCHFRTRCPLAEDRCRERAPALTRVSESHSAACLLLDSTTTADSTAPPSIA